MNLTVLIGITGFTIRKREIRVISIREMSLVERKAYASLREE